MDVIKSLGALLILVGTLYGSYKSISFAQRNLGALIHARVMLLVMRLALIIVGGLAGLLLTTLSWRVSKSHIIVGLPFPWAVWEYSNGQWLDFVSQLSIVPWLFDLIFGIALTHALVVVAYLIRQRRGRRIASGAI